VKRKEALSLKVTGNLAPSCVLFFYRIVRDKKLFCPKYVFFVGFGSLDAILQTNM
jgi:hypothetical protein